ncbi:hypothetical protein [Actinophytocola sp.]|uniref:LuxE/PaaK family acyltransferase n=1 Tax=Actinophytocola sp. TaxID=1872138 RepID=UPI003899B8A4
MTSLTAVDDLVYQREDAFELSGRELADLQRDLLRESVEHHLEACHSYRRYAESNGWSDALLAADDLVDRIPLLPATVFKRRDVISGPRERVVKVCTSSGTQGGRSRVHRDSTTMERFLGSIDRGADLLLANRAVERRLFVLGPDTDEAADLWFSYVLSIVDLLYPTDFFVRDDVLRLDEFAAAISAERPERPLVIGPPVLVRDAALRLRELGIRPGFGDRGGLVVTAGGWKKFDSQALPRDEFTDVVRDAFGLADRAQVRDCYNAVELNTVLFECEHGAKHVPAWVHASARDPVTQRPLEPGQVGPLAFCDALPTSYPGFVLTDDLGTVSAEGACPCGRASRVLSISRRVESVEARGCALKMDRAVSR